MTTPHSRHTSERRSDRSHLIANSRFGTFHNARAIDEMVMPLCESRGLGCHAGCSFFHRRKSQAFMVTGVWRGYASCRRFRRMRRPRWTVSPRRRRN